LRQPPARKASSSLSIMQGGRGIERSGLQSDTGGCELKDARKKSLSEAFVNAFGGYPIGYCLGIVMLPLSIKWIEEDPLTVSLLITLVYTLVSFARSYFLRRAFERLGIEDNFIRICIKMIRCIKDKFEFPVRPLPSKRS